jgi:hypothetical protein
MDSNEITENTKGDSKKARKPDDFPSIIVKTLLDVDWYLYFVICIAFLVVVSDIYSQRILQNFAGAMKGDEITTWGHIMQMLSLILMIILGKIAKSYF